MDLLGKTVEVDIIDTGKHYLMGKIIHETLVNMPRLSPLSADVVSKNKVKSVRNILSCLSYIVVI